eukprot:244132-Chlamydomonas_euryale.AAC.25
MSQDVLCDDDQLRAAAADLARRDERAARREYAFDLPHLAMAQLIARLNDPRDAPCALLAANLALTTLPGALAVLLLARSHWIGLAFVVCNYLVYMQRYMLTLHVTEHRPLFRKGGPAAHDRDHAARHADAPCGRVPATLPEQSARRAWQRPCSAAC